MVAVKLVDEMFCRFSLPKQVHSDQGRQFKSHLLKEVYYLLQIKKTHTTLYRPQGNVMVERFNRTLLDMLATAVGDHPSDWEIHIRKLCFAYKCPLHYRVQPILSDVQSALCTVCIKKLLDYVHQLRGGLKEAYALVRKQCKSQHINGKRPGRFMGNLSVKATWCGYFH